MKPRTTNLVLVPSVIDRLMNPNLDDIVFSSRSNALNSVKEFLRRDLEALLNTRLRCSESDDIPPELAGTVVNYGVPDFTGASFIADTEREVFRKRIEQIVLRFEPRYKRVSVSELKPIDSEDRTLRFRIEADLRIEPSVKPIVFTSTVDSVTRKLSVEGEVDG